MAHLNPVPLNEVKDDDIRERFEHCIRREDRRAVEL